MTFYSNKRRGIFNVNGDAIRNGVDGSSQYAKRKQAHFTVYDYQNGQSVTFKAFLESFSIDNDNRQDEDAGDGAIEKHKKESVFSYDISLSVPSTSTNEGRNNLAKFAALERLISMSPAKVASIRRGSSTGLISPTIGFALNNLIQDGKYRLGDKFDSSGINHTRWMPGVIKEISYTPEMDMGFYEFDNKLIGKVYSLKLRIDCIPQTADEIYVNGFNLEGNFSELSTDVEKENSQDTTAPEFFSMYNDQFYWPFGLVVGNRNLGSEFSNYLRLKQINSINLSNSDAKYAKSKNMMYLGIAADKTQHEKFLLFKCYMESYSYNKGNEVEEVRNLNSPSGVFYNFSGTMTYSWSVKINVPSNSVYEAILNLAKINILYRMSIQHNASLGSGETGLFKDAGHVYVRLMNLIFDPAKPYTKKYNSSTDILKTGLLCTMEKIGFSVDTEQGFYEHRNHFIPKAFTLDFEFKYAGSTPNFGSPLDLNGNFAANAGDGGTWPFGMDWIPNQVPRTSSANTSEQTEAQIEQQMSSDVAAEYNSLIGVGVGLGPVGEGLGLVSQQTQQTEAPPAASEEPVSNDLVDERGVPRTRPR